MQNFSSFHIDKAVVGRNVISKNANNVVITSPRVLILSRILVPEDSFPYIWSRDLERFRFGRQGAPEIFFQAEDGIRDFCLSRGLGDVYKRQAHYSFVNVK